MDDLQLWSFRPLIGEVFLNECNGLNQLALRSEFPAPY